MNRPLTISAVALSFVVAPAVAWSQTSPPMEMQKVEAPHVAISEPIKVSNCEPKPPETTWVGTGFAPAYYPVGVGPYWGWGSVYGPSYYSARPVTSNASLGIDYHNNTNVVMKQVEFGLVVNGNLVAEARDVGTFSPGAEIKHVFGLNPGIFPIRGLPHCVPLKITFDNGTKWKNPHLPALRRQIYGHP
ncbi:MAG TPA: hypothetical protein VMF61_17350 [Candidatus Acidoferrales bacterium]|nr:hypothetical protein [Candidatus Acidoferrales bacterium]